MEEAGGRGCEGSRVEDRRSWRSNEMEGRSASDCGGDKVYPATFGNEEETGLKLDDDDVRKPIRPNAPIAQRANGYAAVLPQSLYDPMPIHFRALVHNAHLR